MRLAVAVLAVIIFAAPASAYQESDASELWQSWYEGDVVASVGHAPELVQSGEQFTGTLHLQPGHNVTSVSYQVCIVAESCIIAPRPATMLDADTYTFDTASFINPLTGSTHRWHAGEWIGIQWFVGVDGLEAMPFPQPWGLDEPRCDADPIACQETHYFTFYISEADKSAPGAPLLAGLVLLAGLAAWRRHGHA